MRITESALHLAATHTQSESRHLTVSRQRDERDATNPLLGRPQQSQRIERGALPQEPAVKLPARATPSNTKETPVREEETSRDLTPEMRFIRELLRRFFGVETEVSEQYPLEKAVDTTADSPTAPVQPQQDATAGSDVMVVRAETVTATATIVRSEALAFTASGVVRTADGRTIEFAAGFALSRSESVSVSLAATQLTMERAPRMKDPLVIDFAGSHTELADIGFRFDLLGNGALVNLPVPVSGKGFLVFDRNGNGRVDDGKELFGPATGDGFAELAALDSDVNGWIDEGDAAYDQLYVWHPFAADRLISLRDADIGALATQNVATRFTTHDANGNPLGQLQSSSIYLRESGGAGTVSHLDLRV